jgi:hypothetical protein
MKSKTSPLVKHRASQICTWLPRTRVTAKLELMSEQG